MNKLLSNKMNEEIKFSKNRTIALVLVAVIMITIMAIAEIFSTSHNF